MGVKLEFIDTNVLLYSVDNSEPIKQQKAVALLTRLWHEQTGCLSVQVMQEFYANATRKLRPALSPTDARALLLGLMSWSVHTINAAQMLEATVRQEQHQLSIWDALILTSAIELNCQVLWSEDLNAGQQFGNLEVKNPFA